MSSIKKNNKKVITGRINARKVFPNNNEKIKVEEINMQEALNSRVKRNKGLYNKNNNGTDSNNINNKQVEKKLSNTLQQKFNFDNKKIKIEDDMDNSFFKEKKTRIKPKEKKPVSIKIEDISMKKAMRKGKKKTDSMVVTMLFLAVVIVFMGVFLIYHFGTFDHSKTKVKYKKVEVVPENIVFLGDSITEQYDLEKYFPKRNVVNSGIGGNTTKDILDDMKGRVYRYNPSHVFLLIGTNDYANEDISKEETINNIKKIISNIKKKLPKTKIYVESIYPINDSDDKRINHGLVNHRDNKDIKEINKEIKKYTKKEKIKYVDIYDRLVDDKGNLDLNYTKEGLHINDEGYEIITWEINKILEDD